MLELWGGVECTVARLGDRYTDQLGQTGHHARLSDLDAFATLGLKALRFPVLWERVAPDSPTECDWRWTDERLARLRELGIRPIIGLVHHGSGPRYTSLADPTFPRGLADFAARVAERYPWVKDYTPVNEPLTTARFSGLYGHWYPHGRDPATFLRLLMTELEAIRLAMGAIRSVVPSARLVQTDDLGHVWAPPSLQYQAEFENERRWLSWDLLTGRVTAEHRLRPYLLAHGLSPTELDAWAEAPCTPDIIGVNHYLSSERYLDPRTELYEEWRRGGNGRDLYADVEAVRVVVDGCAGPEVLLREAWHRYGLPLAVTEAHNGCTRDEQMRWFAEIWDAADRLRGEGVDIRAVTAWSLLGAFDWNSLLTRQTGFYEPGVFDIRAPKPRATAMAGLLRDLGRTGRSDHPALDQPGWWHRHDRFQYPPVRCRPLHGHSPARGHTGKSRSLLIVGRRGTLGQAFARACVIRALDHHLVGRETFDIADRGQVARVLEDIHPWAVINAAGCVDVDDAERHPERCWRENAVGPEILAEVCASLGIRLVTFSSDLVFDGRVEGAYCENDAPAPLNVYGRSKEAAERSVLALCPEAMIVRTSAFFGPWDSYNFATQTLARLKRGGVVEAVSDVTVSPTYVPDLAEATLDLLIDGESGIWHLANGLALSWHDFASRLAAAFGYPTAGIIPIPAKRAGWAARRPANSSLVSVRARLMPALETALDRYVDAIHAQGDPPTLSLGLLAAEAASGPLWRQTSTEEP